MFLELPKGLKFAPYPPLNFFCPVGLGYVENMYPKTFANNHFLI